MNWPARPVGRRAGGDRAAGLESLQRDASLLPVEHEPKAGLALVELGTLGYEFSLLIDSTTVAAVDEGLLIYAEACLALGWGEEALAKLRELEEADECGSLEKLYERYHDRGFEVLGFPANEFMGQEPGSNEEIQAFCRLNYGVKFPTSAATKTRPRMAPSRRRNGSGGLSAASMQKVYPLPIKQPIHPP